MSNCQIKGNVFNAPNGKKSLLYKSLKETVGTEQAKNMFVLAYSDDFKKYLNFANITKKDFDTNGEIKSNIVINYVREKSETEQSLNIEEQIEVKKLMSEFPTIENSEQLLDILEDSFYIKGLFNPSKKSLSKSGIYTDYEIENILNDIELQKKIKSLIERLKNSSIVYNSPYDFKKEYILKGSVNILGKLSLNNPLKLEQEVINKFAGKVIEQIDTDLSVDYEYLNKFKRIPEIDQEGNYVKEQVIYDEAVKTLDDRYPIIEAIDTLLNAPEVVDTSKLEEKLTTWLYNYGIDIEGFKKELLPSLKDFLQNPYEENINTFSKKYMEVFAKQDTVREIPTIIDNKERDYVYLNTNLSEQYLFDNLSLLKTNNKNIFHKVEKIDFDLIKEALELEDTVSEIQAYKDYFGYKEQKEDIPNINYLDFSGDVEYLTNEFIADFNVEKLKNKGNEFFDSFKITEKGIELVSKDAMTLDIIKYYLTQPNKIMSDLIQYSLLSKNLPNFIDNIPQIDNRNTQRINVINNPNILQNTSSKVKSVNKNVVAIENPTDNFIKYKDQVYELIERQGNTGIYTKLETNQNQNYYDFSGKQNIEFGNIDYAKIENYSSIPKKYGKAVKEDFNCL